MSKRELALSYETLIKRLRYEPDTGKFYWLSKTPDMYENSPNRTKGAKCAAWNGIYAGSEAGTARPDGYFQIAINGHCYLAHRLACLYMNGCWPQDQVDHKDMCRSNNRIANLREATRSQNHANKRYGPNTSGVRGVSWCSRDRKWLAQIKIKGKNHRLGTFETIEAAAAVFNDAKIKHFGEFARID
jgi:hypothetical protein